MRSLRFNHLVAIDYRGLLERLSIATSRQNIRAIVYSKIEGLPIAPVRTLYTPNRSVSALPVQYTPTRVSSSVVTPVAIKPVPSPATATTISVTPIAVSSSSEKDKAKVTPKSVRIELPASTPEPRKHTLPKSSLSISVTAEDVSVTSGQEEVIVPSQASTEPADQLETEKLQEKTEKKEKKRKRGDEGEDEIIAPAEESTPVVKKARKKHKKNMVESDGLTAAQRKAAARREARLKKTEAARKAAKAVQGDKDAIKLAASLNDNTGTDSANVSQSEDGTAEAASRKEKKRLSGLKKRALERSLMEASDSMPSEDVHMDDSAVVDDDTSVAPPADAPVDHADDAAPVADAPEEPVVSIEVSTTAVSPVPAPVTPTPVVEYIEASSSQSVEPMQVAEPVQAVEPVHPVEPVQVVGSVQEAEPVQSPEPAQSAVPEPKPNRRSMRKQEGKRQREASTPVQNAEGATLPAVTPSAESSADTIRPVDSETQPPAPSGTDSREGASSMVTPTMVASTTTSQEPKTNRADRRKSLKNDQSKHSPTPADAPVTAESSISPATAPATVEKSKPEKSKGKRKGRPSSAAAALAEWRAKQSQGDVTNSDASQAVSSSAVAEPETMQQDVEPKETNPEEEPAVQMAPAVAEVPSPSQKPDTIESAEQPAAASDSEKTPPASSAQIPLPPRSQQIARLPSSSPESYPSDSEESQDAWQRAHKRMRSPGSEDLEPEGDDEDDEEEGSDTGRGGRDQVEEIDESEHDRATPEAIATFTEPASASFPMDVDPTGEDEEIESGSATPPAPSSPMSAPPSSMSPVVYTIPVPSIQQKVDEPVTDEPVTDADEPEDVPHADVQEDVTPVASPREETPSLFAVTQDAVFTPTQARSVPTPLTLTDLAAPTSPQMPSTGIVAFHDAMEEDAAADQAAMDKVNDSNNINGEISAVNADQADDVSQSATDSATSRVISSQSQTSSGSPRRLRSRMRLRDGSQPESDPLKPLPLPSATPKKRGRPPKALSQAGTPVQKVSHVITPQEICADPRSSLPQLLK